MANEEEWANDQSSGGNKRRRERERVQSFEKEEREKGEAVTISIETHLISVGRQLY